MSRPNAASIFQAIVSFATELANDKPANNDVETFVKTGYTRIATIFTNAIAYLAIEVPTVPQYLALTGSMEMLHKDFVDMAVVTNLDQQVVAVRSLTKYLDLELKYNLQEVEEEEIL